MDMEKVAMKGKTLKWVTILSLFEFRLWTIRKGQRYQSALNNNPVESGKVTEWFSSILFSRMFNSFVITCYKWLLLL